MPGIKTIIIGGSILLGISNAALAQDTNSVPVPVKEDTVILSPDKIDTLTINCPVLNSFGSGDEELLVLNSPTDVQYAFGYNCDFPNVDFSAKTILRFSIKVCGPVTYKIKIIGNLVLYCVTINKNCFEPKRQIISIMIPKIGLDSSVNMEINEVGKH